MAIAAGVLAFSAPVSEAVLTPKSSADFNWKYEADVLPNDVLPASENWVHRVGGTGPNTASVTSGTLSLSSPSAGGSFQYYEARAVTWLDVVDLADGFTAEIRVKVDAGKTFGGMQVGFLSDTSLGAGLAGLVLTGTDTQWLGTGIVDAADNDDAFHVFRIVKLPSIVGVAGKFNLYRDGALILDDVAGSDPGFAPPNRFFFGDYGTFDSAGEVDYVRWDTTGAFAPVPEPTSLALAGVALALMLVRRRRA